MSQGWRADPAPSPQSGLGVFRIRPAAVAVGFFRCVGVVEIVEACAQGDVDEAHEAAALLLASIDELPDHYQNALQVHGIERPYAPRT